MLQELHLKKLRDVPGPSVVQDVDWLCRSFGLVTTRDKDETSARIFQLVVDAAAKKRGVTSDLLAEMTHLTRGAVVHHINSFISAGVLVKEQRTYVLRSQSIKKTVEEIQKDAERIFEDLKKIAEELDQKLGLAYR